MHGCLELAEGRTVVGIVCTGVDIVCIVLELVIQNFWTYEGDVGEGGCGARIHGSTVRTVVALETIALRGVGNLAVADREALLYLS